MTLKVYRDAVRCCKEKICVAKDQFEFKLASTMKDTNTKFLIYINTKRRMRDNIDLLLDESSNLTNRHTDKVKTFNSIFTCAFNTNDGPCNPLSPVLEGCDWRNDKTPANPELLQDLLLQLDVHNSMGPDVSHSILLHKMSSTQPEETIICWVSS